MKKAFTLVEMLIVVVVLVTLMSITFRLSSVGDDQERRNQTVVRLQRLEYCLSGYYAAYGTYPPVKLHGSRNYNLRVNRQGIQSDEEEQVTFGWYRSESDTGIGSAEEEREWAQVRAACLSQPVAMRAPMMEGCNDAVQAMALRAQMEIRDGSTTYTTEEKQIIAAGFDDGWTTDGGSRFNADSTSPDWRDLQLFQFGVLSFLLPRYLVMMNGPEKFFSRFQQWSANNALPLDPLGAGKRFANWLSVYEAVREARNPQSGDYKRSLARVLNIPSQAACARWLPNLEKTCALAGYVQTEFFGVDVVDTDVEQKMTLSIFAPGGGSNDSTSDQYMLGGLSIVDGWGNDVYYYSPSPHQGYVVWSAGKNGRTFPPWVPRESLDSPTKSKAVGAWIEDDIVNMSH